MVESTLNLYLMVSGMIGGRDAWSFQVGWCAVRIANGLPHDSRDASGYNPNDAARLRASFPGPSAGTTHPQYGWSLTLAD
jgi:hypothetical protein